MKKTINVTRSSMPSFEEFCEEVRELWDTRWLTNMGVKHKKLEAELQKYLGIENIALYTNGHLALENIISAFQLQGEIITTPFTFASTTHAIVRNNCTPVFCAIDPYNYTIDANKIESLITEKTSAILPVHVYGNLCDVDKIQRIADKYHLKVIYDAAHAFGVKKNGCSAANYGDASMFSFHATKVFHTIEGGAVVFKEKKYKQILNDMKNFGIRGPEDVAYIGGNAKMNEFQASMGLCNLRHIDDDIAKRKKAFDRYCEHFDAVKGLQICKIPGGIQSNYAYFPILFDEKTFGASRDDIFVQLESYGVMARKYFYPLTSDFACYGGISGFDSSLTPVAKAVANRILTLPIYSELLLEDVDRICQIILNCRR